MSRLTDEQVQMEIEFRERYGESACADLHRELLELRAVVAKLPKTADGVPISIGDAVWLRGDYKYPGYVEYILPDDEVAVNDMYAWPNCNTSQINEWTRRVSATLYSTKEAALAARNPPHLPTTADDSEQEQG